MVYPLLKVFHITSMVFWLGGMFTFSIIGATANGENAAALRVLFGKTVTTAMLATWAAGLSLAAIGGWFTIAAWPFMKITGAFVLSGVHGMVAGRLTKLAGDDEKLASGSLLSVTAPVITVLVMVR